MSWIELVHVEAHLFYPDDEIELEPKPLSPTDVDIEPDEPVWSDTIHFAETKPVLIPEWYYRVFPSDIENCIGESGVLSKPVVGFNFVFFGQQVGKPHQGLLQVNCEQNSFEDFIDEDHDCPELLRIVHHLIAKYPPKQERSFGEPETTPSKVRYVEFLAVWDSASWWSQTDYGDEWNCSSELHGFIDLRAVTPGTSLQITTLDQIPEGETNENTKSNL